ncbi:MAG: bifunctional folylpolyglutamate synthase/dihydrofolate synthase, partial [Acutalibacteraceae bacterium]|nr:bifunctional folylpolyglutamate synthase/dihydrofolate synthase [Acutalibacteraceae bacterium]
DMPRSLKAEELAETASKVCPCIAAENYDDALKKATEISNGDPIFIFGSLYLAADIRKILK